MFEYFAALTTVLDKNDLQPLLSIILSPVHRVLSAEQGTEGGMNSSNLFLASNPLTYILFFLAVFVIYG